jgi:hypothetical protein
MSIARIRPAYSFTPTQIPSCQLWLDAMDGSSITLGSGSSVSTWADKSGLGNNATSSNGTATYTANSVYFPGSANLTTNANLTLNTVTIFTMFKYTGGTGGGVILISGYSNTSSTGGITVLIDNGAGSNYIVSKYGTANIVTGPSGSAPGAIPYLISFVNAASVPTLFQNGSNVTTNVSTQTFSGTYKTSIGSDLNVPYYITGNLYELIAFNTALNTTQRQQVEGYLAQKWGLKSNLPGNHPGTKNIYWPKKAMPFAIPTPFYTAFSPVSIPGCALWLDAADQSTMIFSGSVITTWADKSGNGRTATSSGSPTLSSNQVVFSGSQWFSGSLSNTTANLTAFVVAKITINPAAAASRIISASAGGLDYDNTASMDVIVYLDSANTLGSFRNFVTLSTVTTTPNQTFIAVTRTNSTTNTFYLNGTASSTVTLTGGAVGSFGYTTYWVGNGPSGNAITGTVSEVLYYHADLTNTQRQQIESYLAAKWSLTTSLPTNHPHFTQPAGHNPKIPLQLTINQLYRSPNYYLIGLTYQSLSQTYWNNNWQPYLQSLASSPITATVNIGAITASGTNYQGLVLAPNGYIYCVPCNATSVGYINPANGQFGTFGSASSGGFVSGALAPNGNIYCMKFYGGNIGIITPGASPASSTWSETGPSIADSRFSCCFGPDGLLYIPSPNAANIGVYTPGGSYSTSYLTNIGTITGGYAGAVLAPNGKIYCIPNSATNVGVIDTVARTFTVAGLTVTGSATGYRGGVLAANGKIYCLPQTNAKVGVIDPIAGTFTDALITNQGAFTIGYMTGTLGPDGNIYCMPENSLPIAVINVQSNTFSTFGSSIAAANGSILAPNGTIYTAPTSSTAINTITFSGLSQLPNSNWCLSAYANHI